MNKRIFGIGWALIPPEILKHEKLSANEKLLWGRIYSLITDEGYCYASNEWLSFQIGVEKGSVSNIVSSLVTKGVLKRVLVRDERGEIKERQLYPLSIGGLRGINRSIDRYQLNNGIESIENSNIEGSNTYTLVFNCWNEQKIIVHKVLTAKTKRAINGRLKEKYVVEDILGAIRNYSAILKDEQYYFKYKWTLQDFLQRGFEKFLDFKVAKTNYSKRSVEGGTHQKDFRKENYTGGKYGKRVKKG